MSFSRHDASVTDCRDGLHRSDRGQVGIRFANAKAAEAVVLDCFFGLCLIGVLGDSYRGWDGSSGDLTEWTQWTGFSC